MIELTKECPKCHGVGRVPPTKEELRFKNEEGTCILVPGRTVKKFYCQVGAFRQRHNITYKTLAILLKRDYGGVTRQVQRAENLQYVGTSVDIKHLQGIFLSFASLLAMEKVGLGIPQMLEILKE